VPFVDCDYDAESWFERTKGLEYDPERGGRCTACFDMRMEVTAAYAAEKGFDCFTTTNATSRWKDVQQVNGSGVRAAAPHDGVAFWDYDWQTDAMTKRKYEVSASEKFYKQEYCGCSYSLRDSNLWRKKEGIPPVKIGGEAAGLGTRYFNDPETDAAEEKQEVVDQFFKDAETHFDNARLQKLYEGRKKDQEAEAGKNNW
jgi:predicted adenine nucleotide alpha hydrolase (AANH) superfamily ATPase